MHSGNILTCTAVSTKNIYVPLPNIQTYNTHINEHHRAYDRARHGGREQRKKKFIYLSIPNSVHFSFNYNILIFKIVIFNTFYNTEAIQGQ
jgi:hypothetical protein